MTSPGRWLVAVSLGVIPVGGAATQPTLGEPISPLRVTSFPDVRAALKLSDKQARELDECRDAVGTEVAAPNGQIIPRGRAELERRAELVLTPGQRTRLRQLAAQRLPHPFPDHHARPEVSRELGTTGGQERDFAAARSAFADAVVCAHLSGDPASDVLRAVEKATAARDAAFRAALTPEQQARLDALFGEPYSGGYEPYPDTPVSLHLARSFGRYDGELNVILSNNTVRDELKIPPERVTVFRQAERGAPRVLREPGAEEADARSEYVSRTLDGLLTPAQARRLRQIMLQAREDRSEGGESMLIVPSAVSYPGVAEAVGLDPTQKDRLLRRADPRDVLAPEQQMKIRKMLGTPFVGRPVWAGVDEKLPPGPRGRVVLELPSEVLGLTAAEATRVSSAASEYRTAPRYDLQRVRLGLPGPSAALEQAVSDGVAPDRLRRIDQLAHQLAFGRDPRAAIMAGTLGITEDQILRLYTVEHEWRAVRRLGIPAGVTLDRRSTLPARHRDRLDELLLAVLTPAQRQTWNALVGEACPAVRRVTPEFSPVRYR